MEDSNVKTKICKEVMKLGFSANHIGTRYIIEVIEIIYNSNNRNALISSMEKNVYAQIAEKYNKNPLTIKSNITKATNYVDYKNLIRNKNNKDYYYRDKLTAKAIVNTVLLNLGA